MRGPPGRLAIVRRGLTARGVDGFTAKQQAIAMIDRQVTAQASVTGFGRIFWRSRLALLASQPLLALVSDAGGRSAGATHIPGANHE
jgi:hypothetical protein